MSKVRKISVKELEKIIKEEVEKLKSVEDEAEKTEEVEADELADTVEHKVDHMKALKIKEEGLTKIYLDAKKAIVETRKKIASLKK